MLKKLKFTDKKYFIFISLINLTISYHLYFAIRILIISEIKYQDYLKI